MKAVQKGRTHMYARVISVQYQLDKMDEGEQLYRDSLVNARQQAGFKEAFGLADRTTGKAMSIVLWETEADVKAREASADFQALMAKFAPLLATAPIIETYEIVVQE